MLKATAEKDKILSAMSKAHSIVDKKTIMNIINNVLLYSKNGELYIEATDLEISFRTHIPVNIIEEGSLTVSARKFYEIVKEIPYPELLIEEIQNNWLKVSVGDKAEYIIAGLPSDDFPVFGNFPSEGLMEIQSSALSSLIERTIFSVSYDERKYALSGILTEIIPAGDGNQGRFLLRMVSSDGHRLNLAEKEIEIPSAETTEKQEAIIPRKGASELKRLAEDSDKIFLKRDDKFLYASTENAQLIIRLIDGTFPDYNAIIPAEKKRFIEFSRPVVLGALKRISIVTTDPSFKGVKASINGNFMEIESIEKKTGQGQEMVKIKYSGEPFDVAFNARYLIDVLQIMKSEDVEFIINDEDSPCVVKGEEDPGFTALIMPMSLEDE